jgi:hypothetical protein
MPIQWSESFLCTQLQEWQNSDCIQLGWNTDTKIKMWWCHFHFRDCMLILPLALIILLCEKYDGRRIKLDCVDDWSLTGVLILCPLITFREHLIFNSSSVKTLHFILVCSLCITLTFMANTLPICLKMKMHVVTWFHRSVTSGCETIFCVTRVFCLQCLHRKNDQNTHTHRTSFMC